MTSEPLAPLCDDDGEATACSQCDGTGRYAIQGLPVWANCTFCGGSGYGPSTATAVDRERRHCLERLARWAHREPLPGEEN